jgi:hypothetical protein
VILLFEKGENSMRLKIFVIACAICLAIIQPAGAAARFADLSRFPQRASAYLPEDADAPIASYDSQRIYADEYLRRHFAPWGENDLSFLDLTFQKIMKYQIVLSKQKLYSEGGKPLPKKALASIADNGEIYVTASPRPGVALAAADVRALPYGRPLYASRATALGQGGRLKQDILQCSVLRPGEPLAIYFMSRDAKWAFVANGTVAGWAPSPSVALVDEDFMDAYEMAGKAVVTRDNLRICDSNGRLLCVAKLGTVLPYENEKVLVPARGENGTAVFVRARDMDAKNGAAPAVAAFPVPLTPRNAASAIDQMMGERYGWGGAGGLRDCSAMTRDYFSLFGVWLPRNSGDQSLEGARIKLSDTPAEARSRVIASSGVPFASIIHMPGHIMLYLGVYDGEPVVFHNTWGVRTKSGRAVVGKTVVSGLKLGAELPGKPARSLLIDRADAISFPIAGLSGGGSANEARLK